MKFLKKTIAFVCILALLIGVSTFIVICPTDLPEKRDVLIETEPTENPLRLSTKVEGVGETRFFIQSPKVSALNAVHVSSFGVDPSVENNAEALNAALAYCQENPGTRLVFEKDATYYVSDILNLNDLTDVCVDGNGAKIIYSHGSGLVRLRRCDCVEIRDLTFDWDWDKQPLGALARAVEVKDEKNAVDFVFDVPAYAREDMFYAITQCDDETGVYGEEGTLIEFYDENHDEFKSFKKIGNDTVRVYHNGALARFPGKKFLLRGTAYGGSLYHIDECRNVTLESLNLYGGGGMGLVIGNRTSHFALRNIFIGPNPEYADTRCMSFGADAVHINDSDGCFLIEGCDFSRQGDDDVNINSGIAQILSVSGKTIVFEADGSMNTDPGDRMAFRDKNFNLIKDFTATIEVFGRNEEGKKFVTFREDIPAKIGKDCMFFNLDNTGNNYVIRNNYFHEHRARSLLLQTSNGLVENNVFYRTTHNAIKIVMDINGVWHEGTGADNIELRNNKFIECGRIGTEVIEVGTKIMEKSSGSYAFTNIKIENNEFRDIYGRLMVVNNVNNFVFSHNTITLGDVYRSDIEQGRAYFQRYCVNVDFSDNTYTDAELLTKIVRSNDPLVWVRANARALLGIGGAR